MNQQDTEAFPTPFPALMLTVKQAGQILNLSPPTMRKRIREGELPAVKLGPRSTRIRYDDVINYGAKVTSA